VSGSDHDSNWVGPPLESHKSSEKSEFRHSTGSQDTLILDLDDESDVTVPPPVKLPEPGERVSGRFSYRIEQKIGSGAFSGVYVAECLDTTPEGDTPPQHVAIKVLSLASADGGGEGVRRELSSLLAIRCPHIPRVYDWSLDESRVFVVMEYFPAGSLRAQMPKTGALEEEEAWKLLHDLLIALVSAHKSSILHLDIKPANVLIDDRDHYVLTDFGISQGIRAGRESFQMLGMGTPGYQAPEQRWVQPDLFDMRTDLFGVGATVWSCYTGINLANPSNAYLLPTNRQAEYGLPLPSRARSFCSQELESILLHLLYQDPGKRPGSAAEVLAAIGRVRSSGKNHLEQPGVPVDGDACRSLMAGLIDPVWNAVFQAEWTGVRKLQDGEDLCVEGQNSYLTYVLLSGQVQVLQKGKALAIEGREGTFLGEVSALTGGVRTATLRAIGDVYVRALNASQLERLVTSNPALGVRLIRSMAERLARESP
jgi:serine/threonine protein kinase